MRPAFSFPCLLVYFCLWFCGFSGTLHAQSASGALRGSVQDADFYVPVPGVQILLEGTGFSATTDENGSFFLNAVPPGEYAVLASKSGYVRERRGGVVVSAGSVREVSLSMTAEVVELDEFLVETSLLEETEVAPLSLGASLQSFASAVGVEALKAAGSGGDIGSAAKRLASTAVVDSRYVVIRGLSDRYNVVVLNSARVPSSDPDKRAVNIDIFPAGLVESLVSSKTFVPSMPGETTGGYLNILTKRIPEKPFFKWSSSSAYNTRAHGNSNFLTDPSADTGFLGTGSERALPDQLRAFDGSTLPQGNDPVLGNTTQWQEPPRAGGLGITDVRNKAFHDNRQTAAGLLAGRSTGPSTMQAPLNFSFSALAGTRIEDFMGGTLGVVAGVTYSKKYQMDQGVRGAAQITTPGQIDQRNILDYSKGQESLLAGALLGATLEFSADNSVSMTYFANVAAEDEAIFASGKAISLQDTANESLFRESLIYTERVLQTLQFTGEHKLPQWGDTKLDWLASYSNSSQDQPDIRKALYAYNFASQIYVAPGDPSPPDFERVWRRLDDTNYNIALNLDIPLEAVFEQDRPKSKLEMGGSMDYSTREYTSENFEYELRNTANSQLPQNLTDPVSPDNSQGYTLGDALGTVDLTDHLPGIPRPGGRLGFSDQIFLVRGFNLPVRETYTATQAIPASYASITFALMDTLEVTTGARIEMTDMRIVTGTSFNALDPNANAGQLLLFDPVTGDRLPDDKLASPGIQRVDFLPALAIKWKMADDMTIRAAISQTVARPTFKELAPAISRDPESGDFFVGYVLLEMSSIVNYDLRWEWDMGRGDLLAVSLFAKYIDKPIENVYNGLFNTVRNDKSATLFGFEIEFNKRLGDVIPVLDGFNFGMNYGYVFSQVNLSDANLTNRTVAGLSPDRPLQGQPEYTFNANISYDDEDSGLSFGLLLNITGPLLYAVGGRANFANIDAPDIYQLTYSSVDAYISKRLLKNWDVVFRASNLLDEPRKRYFVGGLPYSDIRNGTTYSLGLSAKW